MTPYAARLVIRRANPLDAPGRPGGGWLGLLAELHLRTPLEWRRALLDEED